MPNAGDIVRATDPFRRLATDKQTAASGAITTTETAVHTVTADLINGATYAITMHVQAFSTVANDTADARIREDNTTGTQLQQNRSTPFVTGAPSPRTQLMTLYAEYTAGATASKTFVGTLVRQNGTGNITRNPSATSPSYMFIDRIS